MYKQYKPSVEPVKYVQQSLDLFDGQHSNVDVSDYVKTREEGTSEFDFFYNPSHFSEIINARFAGKVVTIEELNDFIDYHETIPGNSKREVKSILEKLYGMKVIREGKKIVSYQFEAGSK